MRRCLLLPLLLAFALSAADPVTGHWSGILTITAPEPRPGDPALQTAKVALVADLQQTGDTVTGTVTPAGKDPIPIEHGKLQGSHLTFEVNANPSLQFDGALSGPLLNLTVEGSVTVNQVERKLKGTLDLKRS